MLIVRVPATAYAGMASSMRAAFAGNSSTWSARSDSVSWVRVCASIRGTIVLLFESTHAMARCKALMLFSVANVCSVSMRR